MQTCRPIVTVIAAVISLAVYAAVAPAQTSEPVSLNGHSFKDAEGEFLGLGVSYFQALRRTKFDPDRYRSDLAFLSRCGFNYIRTLSMVGWPGKEIVPITFTNDDGATLEQWEDYWEQFERMIDIAYDDYGIRTQVTIFADAQLILDRDTRIAHMQNVLDHIRGREHKVMLLEVANEAWQNGFPGDEGIAQLREFGKYLADRTEVPIALSATFGQTNESLEQMYAGSAADIATEHFTRDTRTAEGGWLPVRDAYRVNSAAGVPPVSSNEPIGPGSSVASEDDPIKLVSAAAYAWMSGLPMYVYHTSAGVSGDVTFEEMAGARDFLPLGKLLPRDIANWPQRTEGDADFAPFVTYTDDRPNTPWTSVPGAERGAIRHLSVIKGDDFCTLLIGILPGGVELEARRDMKVGVFNPLNGELVNESSPDAGQRLTLPQGPGAFILRGRFKVESP